MHNTNTRLFLYPPRVAKESRPGERLQVFFERGFPVRIGYDGCGRSLNFQCSLLKAVKVACIPARPLLASLLTCTCDGIHPKRVEPASPIELTASRTHSRLGGPVRAH